MTMDGSLYEHNQCHQLSYPQNIEDTSMFEDEMDHNEYLRSCFAYPQKRIQMRAATILGHLKSKAYSDSESIEKHIRGLTERFWRGKEKGLSDLCLLAFSCLTSFIPRSREADARI